MWGLKYSSYQTYQSTSICRLWPGSQEGIHKHCGSETLLCEQIKTCQRYGGNMLVIYLKLVTSTVDGQCMTLFNTGQEWYTQARLDMSRVITIPKHVRLERANTRANVDEELGHNSSARFARNAANTRDLIHRYPIRYSLREFPSGHQCSGSNSREEHFNVEPGTRWIQTGTHRNDTVASNWEFWWDACK